MHSVTDMQGGCVTSRVKGWSGTERDSWEAVGSSEQAGEPDTLGSSRALLLTGCSVWAQVTHVLMHHLKGGDSTTAPTGTI